MKYNVEVSADGKRVEVKVCTSVTADLERSLAEEAVTLAKSRDIWQYFVDVSGVPNFAAPFDQYRLAYQDMARLGLGRRSRFAVVHSPGDQSHDFIETVMRNAGYQCRLFEDRLSALNWLSEGDA
jgi:hypothetical protein